MKSLALYFLALTFHAALLYLTLHLGIFRRHPIFFLWLLTGLLANLALWMLYWAQEERFISPARRGLDWLWWALLLASLIVALMTPHDWASGILTRGILALLVLTVLARLAARASLAGGLGATLSEAVNYAYLPPIAWLVWKFSRAGFEPLAVLASRISHSRFQIQDALGWARSALG
jgi:hypothetical protein